MVPLAGLTTLAGGTEIADYWYCLNGFAGTALGVKFTISSVLDIKSFLLQNHNYLYHGYQNYSNNSLKNPKSFFEIITFSINKKASKLIIRRKEYNYL